MDLHRRIDQFNQAVAADRMLTQRLEQQAFNRYAELVRQRIEQNRSALDWYRRNGVTFRPSAGAS